MKNKICTLLNIQYPIIQAGMIWCSGWELASAVSNSGGLGVIGAGSMYPEVLDSQIIRCKEATDKPFGVNLPMLYPDIEKHIETEDIMDPVSIEQKTGTFKGSLYGTSSNSKFAAFFRPANFTSKFKGLYFCGGTVHPGGGIPLCLKSAYIMSEIIKTDYEK